MGQSQRQHLFFLFCVAVPLLFVSCPLEDDPLNGKTGIDPRLFGVWRFGYGDAYEEFKISPSGNASILGTFESGGFNNGATNSISAFKGDIVYAESFSASAGILIIKYWRTPIDYKPIWLDWSQSVWPHKLIELDPQPTGEYYGVYFINMREDGRQVFLACSSDQSANSGPTETDTLEEAIAKFSVGNMNQMLDLSVGDPQTKVGDL
jgi:hypothetical protein